MKEVISGGRPGGCPGCASPAAITPEIKMVAGHGVKKLSAQFSQRVGGNNKCGSRLVLVEIKDVKTQVVSGTNFVFTLTLESRAGSDCSERTRRTCSGVHVYRHWSCKQEHYAECLEIIRTEKISCDDDENDTISVPEIHLETGNEEFDPCFSEKNHWKMQGSF